MARTNSKQWAVLDTTLATAPNAADSHNNNTSATTAYMAFYPYRTGHQLKLLAALSPSRHSAVQKENQPYDDIVPSLLSSGEQCKTTTTIKFY